MKRKILGLLVLGIALVPLASSAMTTGPEINYLSQTGSPSGSYYLLRAAAPTGGYIAQTIMFDVSTRVRRVSQSNLAQGNVNGGGDGVFPSSPDCRHARLF